MSSELHVTAEHDGTVSNADLREAFTDLDVSESSPITTDAPEVGIGHSEETEENDEGEEETHHYVTLSVAGHEGEWTKTSQDALLDALKNIDGVDGTNLTVEGGHESS